MLFDILRNWTNRFIIKIFCYKIIDRGVILQIIATNHYEMKIENSFHVCLIFNHTRNLNKIIIT